jgi:hypothetical protein
MAYSVQQARRGIVNGPLLIRHIHYLNGLVQNLRDIINDRDDLTGDDVNSLIQLFEQMNIGSNELQRQLSNQLIQTNRSRSVSLDIPIEDIRQASRGIVNGPLLIRHIHYLNGLVQNLRGMINDRDTRRPGHSELGQPSITTPLPHPIVRDRNSVVSGDTPRPDRPDRPEHPDHSELGQPGPMRTQDPVRKRTNRNNPYRIERDPNRVVSGDTRRPELGQPSLMTPLPYPIVRNPNNVSGDTRPEHPNHSELGQPGPMRTQDSVRKQTNRYNPYTKYLKYKNKYLNLVKILEDAELTQD